MSYKLVAVDMDGTLLNGSKQLEIKTIENIKLLINKGIMFIITTGRPIQGIKKYKFLDDLQQPLITYNGTIVFDKDHKTILNEEHLDNYDAKQIFEIGQNFNTLICVWSCNKLYTNKINEQTEFYKSFSSVEPVLIKDFNLLLKNGITKIVCYDTEPNIKKYINDIQLKKLHNTTFFTSQNYFLEFINSNVSKANGVKIICDKYNIDKSEVIAIGDGLNDVSMIEFAGLGVAMGNADDIVKSKADYITDSNNNYGVANFIRNKLL